MSSAPASIRTGEVAAEPLACGTAEIALRRFPYPYKAMLAICSDLDETPDKDVYWETMRFLNTTKSTAMGQGVGLEVGNTIYFDMPSDQFSYWNTDDLGREMVRELILSGHIDCLHSFGDLATSRAHAERALDELSKYGCRLEVWIDHAVAPSNFGGDIMRGFGDVAESDAYHADLTCAYGIRYVWRGRVTSVVGQGVPRSLEGICRWRYPLASARTVAKEYAKGILASLGSKKYAPNYSNDVLFRTQLRSGQQVYEFLRSNPHWGGVSCGETAEGLADVIDACMLDRLVNRSGFSILYTHLGKIKDLREPLSPRTRNALHRLAGYVRNQQILVTTTRRLLAYCRMLREIAFSASSGPDEPEGRTIEICFSGPEKDLEGLTLYVPDPARARILLNGRKLTGLRVNEKDETGRASVSWRWNALAFPDA